MNFGYQFFWDHTYPYSFIPGDYRGNAVLSTSVLNEIHFNPHWGSFLEAGILGINYGDEGPDPVSAQVEHHVTPFLHFGISVFYTSDNWLIQLGASRSQGTISTTKPNPNRWIEPDDGNEVIFHPEIQLQWVF